MRLTTEAAIEFRLLFVFPLQSHLSATRRTRRHWVPLQLLLRDVNDSMNQGNNVCATEQSLSETPNTGRLYCRLRLNTRYFFHSFRGRHSRRSAPVYTRSPASSTVTPPPSPHPLFPPTVFSSSPPDGRSVSCRLRPFSLQLKFRPRRKTLH